MHRALWIVICLTLGTLGTNNTQDAANIDRLFTGLNDPSATNTAARQILEVASKDAGARQYIVRRLPEMIDKQRPEDAVWQNAVDLAGQLKASEAIPSLLKALALGRVGGPQQTTFTTEIRLDDDVVGKALAEIGDPAVPAISKLLASQDRNTRRRAVLILRNMYSPTAHKVLQERLPHEPDKIIKELIETGLTQPSKESPPATQHPGREKRSLSR